MLRRLFLLTCCALLLAFYSGPGPVYDDNAPVVRVRLLADQAPQAVVIGAQGGRLSVYAADDATPLLQLGAGETMTVARRENQLFVDAPDGELYALSLRLVPEEDAVFTVGVTEGPILREPLAFAGSLYIKAADDRNVLQLVNHVGLEDYVASVLGSEYGLDDQEGNKAMAVAIRTYALRSGGKFGDGFDHADDVLSQAYQGLKYVSVTTRAATEATRGEVLTYEGDLIEAVYFSSSGGHTAANEDVWEGEPLPYLRGKPDPYDQQFSPHTQWRSTIPRGQLLTVLSQTAGTRVDGFVLGNHGPDGRVQSVRLLHSDGRETTMTGNRFRLLLNEHFGSKKLKSTIFTAERSGNQYVFKGDGFGHGVGLSQWGAHAMAQEGHSYRDILAYYYTDVSLETLEGLGPIEPLATPPATSPPVAASSPPESAADTPDVRTFPEQPQVIAQPDLPPTAHTDTLATPSPITTWSTPRPASKEKASRRIGW